MNYFRKPLPVLLLLACFAISSNAQRNATPPEQIKLPDGFKIELLYSVPREDQGSWVAMCQDDKGRLIVSDQHGGLYRFPIPKLGERVDPASIQQITYSIVGANSRKMMTGTDPQPMTEELAKLPKIGHAQGICYAFDSLYVVVSSRNSSMGCGVYRLLDTNGDDNFDKLIKLKSLSDSAGEHGPHAIIPSPDGKHLYVIIGNHIRVSADYIHSRVPEVWGEDQLLPPLRYSSKGAQTPLGHIAQMDPEGKTWEIVAVGFRNQYDAAFNRDGELFTYDADMEWDLNTPWYRPTRINHVIDGADYGWRGGSGKFMDYCTDTFGAVVDIGPGSPTGVSFGYGAKFPARYQNAFFACDWSYGKLYAVHLNPKGSTYSATVEEFASAQPLPVTDLLVNPADGAMYLTVGGRRVQSGLYRVTYVGNESTAPAKALAGGRAGRQARHALEAHLQRGAAAASPSELDRIWTSLGSTDRGIRHAARAALEKQPVAKWKGRIEDESNPVAATAALIALARVDAKNSTSEIIEKGTSIEYNKTSSHQTRLDVLRSVTLALTRSGQPSATDKAKLIKWLDGIYPAKTPEENRDLSAFAAYLNAPFAVERGMKLLANASGQEEQIGYVLNLRYLKDGWTPELRKTYFKWFAMVDNNQGGARLADYLAEIKTHATESVPKADLTPALKMLITTQPMSSIPQFTLEPRTFVKNWTLKDFTGDLAAGIKANRDFANGRKMAGAGTCYVCHRFKGEGGAVGPDLTSAGGKFSAYDLLEAIIDPGKEISDQYGATHFNLKDGTVVSGRIMNLTEGLYHVSTDMMKPSTITYVEVDELEAIEASPFSMMPPGLINTMSKDDVLDLLAYLLSGGDSKNDMFSQ